jgi:hypothetical protein
MSDRGRPPSAPPTPPPLPPRAPTDWWGRNWKWFVPLICVVALTAIGGFVAAMFGYIKSSEAYTGAMARVRSNPAVAAALGVPIKDAYFMSGNISVNGATGAADLAIPLSGPKGGGSLFVQESKRLGVWHFDRMIVEVDATRQRIDLSESMDPPVRSSP